MLTLRLALRQLRRSPRFAALFVVNLALGLVGLVTIDAFHRSVTRSVDAQSRGLLGADLTVSDVAPLTQQDEARVRAALGSEAQLSRAVELFSMIAAGQRTRLVEVHAIDARHPLVGGFEAEGLEEPAAQVVDRAAVAVVDPEVIEQLGVRVGEALRLGDQSFTIAGVVRSSTVRSSRRFSLAPRVYIGLAHLEKTGLALTGSRTQHRLSALLADGARGEATARELREAFADTSIRVQTHREAGEQLGRALTSMSDYLGLVALVALFLGALGVAYLFRGYVAERVSELAVLMTLGADATRARRWLTWQLGLLSVAAAVVAWFAGRLVVPWIPKLAGSYLPSDVILEVPLGSLGVALVMALCGSGALSWPLLRRLGALRPAALFREQGMPSLDLTPRGALAYAPAVLLFAALSIWQSRSLLIGALFTGVLTASAALAAVLAWGGLRALERRSFAGLRLRLAVRHLCRARAATVTTFVAIALAALLASLVPQVRASLAVNLERPAGFERPSLFLFDIQEEQAAPLEELLAARGLRLHQKSPLIRARLTAIDGESVSADAAGETALDTREQDTERRFRRRAYNLSYRDGLSASETLVAGRLVATETPPEGVAEATLEERFAQRLGVGLDDRLTFDVQGVDVEAKVVGLRKVRWASFEPNFFVQFQPAALADAPKVFLGGITGVSPGAKEALQAELVERFPNVSIIDVARAVELVDGVLDRIGWAMAAMAAISLLAGLALVFAIARDQARLQRRDIGLMKAVGASFADVRRVVDLELGIVALCAALVGVLTTLGAAALVAHVVFAASFRPDWPAAALTILGVSTATALVGRLASRGALETSAMVLLRERR